MDILKRFPRHLDLRYRIRNLAIRTWFPRELNLSTLNLTFRRKLPSSITIGHRTFTLPARLRSRWLMGGLAVMLTICLVSSIALGIHAFTSSLPPLRAVLPGQQIWNDGASSLLFGTNDTYEWSSQNLETNPDMRKALRNAGFTLVRSFFPDNASDAVIDQRITTIEDIGAQCLGVITNISNTAFDKHLVTYLGPRCQMYEFGNEPDLNNISLSMYLKQWNTLVPQLRRINPTAKFIGPVTATADGKNDFMRGFLDGVKSSGILPDAISFHWYPCWNMSRDDCLSKADSYADVATNIRREVRDTLGKDLPVGISEWNYDPGNPPPDYGDEASFITQFSQRAIQAMVEAGVAFACQFDAASYSGYGRLDMFNVATGQPKPQFLALKQLIQQYRPATVAASPAATTPSAPPAGNGAFGPLVSRGKAVYCSPNNAGAGGPQALVSGHYGQWSFWRTDLGALPAWCAIHVGAGPARLLMTWDSDYVFDYITDTGMQPQDYTIAVSGDSTDGVNGTWQTVVTVTDNHARTREHLLPFAGMSWVKMTVTQGQPHASQPYLTIDQIDLYDVSAGLSDTFLFSGDSISAIAYNRFDENTPAFADVVHAAYPARFPATLDEGFGGWTSDGAVQNIDQFLALNPDIQYWLLGWGTNDAFSQVSPDHFRANMQTLVDKIRQAGHTPILAHIPYINRPGNDGATLNHEVRALNAVIDQITQDNGLIPGPDFYTLFHSHTSTYYLSDGTHPSPAGAIAMNRAWFDVLRSRLFA
ncbi:MAG: hypothetical protein OJF49_001930 [Ktedonobacterales bacterium]|nr:MAG: hypothetical protein OJF49_001930 [Ktedonobacterales bacterium]